MVVVLAGSIWWLASGTPASAGNDSSGSGDAGIVSAAADAGPKRAPTPPPSGQEVLRGRVLDASADPVVGVLVAVTLESGGPVREVDTTAGGAFTVEGLAPGLYRVAVEGAAVIAAEVRRVEVPGDVMTLMVARRVLIEGLVEDGGAPVAGATVEVSGPQLPAPRVTTTGADGHFLLDDLPEGAYAVAAHRGARAAGATSVERFGEGPWDSLTIALGPAAVVEGRVLDAAGATPVPGALVALLPEQGQARTAQADASGRFLIEGVLAGAYAVDVLAPGYLPPERAGLDVAAEQTLALDLTLTRGAVVSGRVVDGEGRPVEGARVELAGEGSGGRELTVSASARARRWARAAGVALPGPAAPEPARVVRGDFLPIGELGVTLGPVPFAPPRGVRVAAPRVTAPVGDPDAPPAELEPPPALVSMLTTDADGRFRADALPAGRWIARAEHLAYAGGESAPIKVGAGASVADVEIVLRRGATLRGRVYDGSGASAPGARVQAYRGDTLVGTAYADETGRYELPRLFGTLRLRAADDHGGEVEEKLTLAAADEGKALERDLRMAAPGGAVAGEVTDPDGRPLAGVRVRLAARDLTTTSDAGGRFELRGAPSGSFAIELAHPDWPTTTLDDVRAGKPLGRVAMVAGGGVDGLVRDAHTRSRIAAFAIEAVGPRGDRRKQSHVAGEFELAGLAAGRWTLTVTAEGYAARTLTLDVPAGRGPRAVTLRDQDIELSRGAILAGRVVDRHGAIVAGAAVACGGVRGTTDKQGRFRLLDVPPGDRAVVATGDGGARGEKAVAVRAGDELVTLEIRLDSGP